MIPEHTEPPPPTTRESLAADLRALGVQPGMIVLLHSSLCSLGWVCGGAQAVVQACFDVLTPMGTLVVPTQTGENSEPSHWSRPPVDASWWTIIRAHMPAFDPQITPSQHMGIIPELVRTWPGSVRSNHPAVSFAAVGHDAALLMADHALDDGLGEGSPLRRMYERGGWVVLLGVDHESNTSLHLAQYRVPQSATRREMGAAILRGGQRIWQTYSDLDLDTNDFPAIGAAFEAQQGYQPRHVAQAETRLLPQRELIDFATAWLRQKYG